MALVRPNTAGIDGVLINGAQGVRSPAVLFLARR